jgi:uncharacterized membrane protein
MMEKLALFLHLLGLVGYAGGGLAQGRLLAASASAGLAAPARDAYERLAATVVTKVELPSLLLSVGSGILFLVHEPAYLRAAKWMHPKLTIVLMLLVLSHLEMFNARAIVRLRERGGSDEEIAGRKRRHAMMNGAGIVLVVAVLVLVSFVRLS